VHASFVDAMGESAAEGRGRPGDASNAGAELRRWSTRWPDGAGFARYLAELHGESRADTPRPPGRVPYTTWWWTDGSTYLGRIEVRHRLTPALRQHGGHIGYDVRPSARRRGHATAMLRAVLPHAAALGIERALLTCDVANEASRRTIEANGGRLEDERSGSLRYWITLEAPRSSTA
jgi:predicted acetyltransferase